jgi:hypothetical protein
MADAELRADSAQVTLPSTLSPNSPAGVATGANGQAPASEGGCVPEALCGHSTAMQRAVANFVAARDYYCSLPVDSDKDENDRAEAAYLQADGVMLETPAENLHDLRAKFDAIWSDAAALPNESTVLAVFADFRRLAGGDVSPIFNPQTWLRYFDLRGGAYVVRGDEVFLLQPQGTDLADNMFELEALGGKPAVDALIRQHCAQEAEHG